MAIGHVLPDMSPEKAKLATKLDTPTFIVTLLVLPALVLSFGDYGGFWNQLSTFLNWGIYSWFFFEFACMMYLCNSPRHYITHNKLDISVLILTVPFLPGAWQAFWSLRLLRLLDMLPFFIEKYLPVKLLHYTLILTFISLFGGGLAFAELEGISLFDGIYWANTTINTVGYGDISPETTLGKFVAMALQWAGQVILALIVVDIAEIARRMLMQPHEEN